MVQNSEFWSSSCIVLMRRLKGIARSNQYGCVNRSTEELSVFSVATDSLRFKRSRSVETQGRRLIFCNRIDSVLFLHKNVTRLRMLFSPRELTDSLIFNTRLFKFIQGDHSRSQFLLQYIFNNRLGRWEGDTVFLLFKSYY